MSITLTSHRSTDELFLVQDYDIPAKMIKSAALDKHIWKLYDHVNIKMRKNHKLKISIPNQINLLIIKLDAYIWRNSILSVSQRIWWYWMILNIFCTCSNFWFHHVILNFIELSLLNSILTGICKLIFRRIHLNFRFWILWLLIYVFE